MDKHLSLKEACELLNVKISWIRKAVFQKTIPYTKVGRLIRFNPKDLHSWLEKNTNK